MIKTIDPILDNRWDAFVLAHPESTIFHHSAWARVLKDIYDRSARYYTLENDNGEILAAAPFMWIESAITGKRLSCLPYCEFCFPLAYHESDLDELMSGLRERVDNNHRCYMEVRGWGKVGDPQQYGIGAQQCFLTHTIDLGDNLQNIRASMDRNGRYNLRYAEKSSVKVRMARDEKDLAEFYKLSIETRRRHHLLPLPYRFYESIYEHVILPGHGFLLLAELDGSAIAANMYFCFKDTIIHEFSVQDTRYFKHRPNYLLIWKAIELASNKSFRYYSFGRTQMENVKLATFKRHWGSREAVLPYYYYGIVPCISSRSQSSYAYRAYTAMNKCLPGFMLKLAGDLIFESLG